MGREFGIKAPSKGWPFSKDSGIGRHTLFDKLQCESPSSPSVSTVNAWEISRAGILMLWLKTKSPQTLVGFALVETSPSKLHFGTYDNALRRGGQLLSLRLAKIEGPFLFDDTYECAIKRTSFAEESKNWKFGDEGIAWLPLEDLALPLSISWAWLMTRKVGNPKLTSHVLTSN